MTITVSPFTVDTTQDFNLPAVGYEMQENKQDVRSPLTYWGVYMDDKHITSTSSKERAEETKAWMEKWLQDRL